MGQGTQIEWTNATWNPVTGCTKVSPGCDHCYAARLTERFGRGPFSQIRLHPGRLSDPLRWRRSQMVFTCSMSDLFHPQVTSEFQLAVFSVMEATPQHVYQVLTKRPGRMAYFANHILASRGRQWPENVWAGTSIESQQYAPRLDVLARVPAKVRFVSAEPLLERIDLSPWVKAGVLHWVIVGGESGPGARLIRLEWVHILKAQCEEAKVPLFVKQLGTAWSRGNSSSDHVNDHKGAAISSWPASLRMRAFPSIFPRESPIAAMA